MRWCLSDYSAVMCDNWFSVDSSFIPCVGDGLTCVGDGLTIAL